MVHRTSWKGVGNPFSVTSPARRRTKRRAASGFVAVYVLVTLSLFVAGFALAVVLGDAPGRTQASAVFAVAAVIGGLGLYVEARRDLYAFSMYVTVLASLMLVGSGAVAVMFGGSRPVSIPVAMVAFAVGAATLRYILRSQFGKDAVPNVLRQRFRDHEIFELQDIQFSFTRSYRVGAVNRPASASIHMQNCLDEERTVRVRLVDKAALFSGAGRLIFVQPDPVKLGPGEVGELTIPVRASDDARGELDLYWSAKISGARGRRLRKWRAQGVPPRIPPWLTLVMGGFAFLFGGLVAWGGGVKFRFRVSPRHEGEESSSRSEVAGTPTWRSGVESRMLDLVLRLKNACAETLNPPPGATAAQVRSNGAVASALGLILMLLTGAVPLVLTSLHVRFLVISEGLMALMLLPYGLFVIGGYRLLTGKGTEQTRYGASASLGRIVFGVLFVFGSMGVLFGLFILVAYVLGWK